MMVSISKGVCVVGLGPSGIVTLKELRAAGLQVTAFDPHSSVGGRWSSSKGEDGISTGVWKELCMNGTRSFVGYSDFEWNKQGFATDSEAAQKAYRGVFPHNTEASAYLEAYVEHFGLKESCVLNTWVESVERLRGGHWKVTVVSNETKEQYEFDYLVVCSGRHAVARNQLVKKDGSGLLNSFDGSVMHSIEVKSIHDFENQRVLVVGAAVSGSDISSELARKGNCTTVVNSVRNVPYHVDRVSPVDNNSIDDILWQRLSVILGRYLPESITSKGLKATVLEMYPNQLTEEITGSPDLVPHDDIRKAGIAMGSNYVDAVKEKTLTLKPGIDAAGGSTVTFVDGSKQDFDVVICATGYDVSFPFLPKDLQDKVLFTSPFTGSKETALYKYTLPPDIPSLAFVGMFYGHGPNFMAFETQARYVASIVSGKLKRPTDAKIHAGVDEFKRYRAVGPMNAYELSIKVSEDLGDEMGITPSTLEVLRNPKRLLTSPLYPYYYRTKENVDGKENAVKAQATFDYYLEHPDEPIEQKC